MSSSISGRRRGRTFVDSYINGITQFYEVDWTSGGLIPVDFGPNIAVQGFFTADGLNQLICSIVEPNLNPELVRYGIGILDLATGVKTVHFTGQEGIYFDTWSGWFPQGLLTVFPRNAPTGTSFRARMSMGAELGEIAAILLESATISGQTYPLNLVLGLGHVDGSGLVQWEAMVTPALLPLDPGDRLTFRGYRFDGQQILPSEPQQIEWR